jgi:hypothetical protein
VITPDVVQEAVDGAVALLRTDGNDSRCVWLETDLAKVERERDRLVAAIAAGGELAGLVEALKEREGRRAALTRNDRRSSRSGRPGRSTRCVSVGSSRRSPASGVTC